MASFKPKACVVIPARYASSRFPGKPLTPLLGKPMVLWVAELSARAVGEKHVYVATDDSRIANVVSEAGFSAVMTEPNALTGTDRLAQAAQSLEYDIFVNVQGDEPLLDPVDIVSCIEMKSKFPNKVINGYCLIQKNEDPNNINLPKVVTNEGGRLVYMSRTKVPAFKDKNNEPNHYKKQVCIYGYSKEELEAFSSFGRKSNLEYSEDIEILRFLELDREIIMYECVAGSLAVDVPHDVFKVEQALRNKAIL
ncbi:MAG: 3-deoxy-manno-octulosonate cytidylyltransferase [Litorivicinaceae bacterium]|nr:3-deoxy-manno-octulosonate cytidylyltransferase [Litorivicinaceae bacterium]